MRIAVLGATGNIGYHLLTRLLADPAVDEVVALARRLPDDPVGGQVRWVAVDIGEPGSTSAIAAAIAGCDVLVDLAWLLQPSTDPTMLQATNVAGTGRVCEAVALAGVPALVYSSSVGAYAPGPKDSRVGEDWPTTGVPASLYSRQKAAVERLLDTFEADHPAVRVVRIRPGIVLSAAAAASQVRYFVGPFLPRALLRGGRLPLAPSVPDLTFQIVHSVDVAAAFAAAATSPDARGAYNVATEPVVDPTSLAEFVGGRRVPLPAALLRGVVRYAHLARLTPVDEGWIDLARSVPLMDTGRARRELGWTPAHDAAATLREWLAGAAEGTGSPTPVLRPAPGLLDQIRGGVRGLSARFGGRL